MGGGDSNRDSSDSLYLQDPPPAHLPVRVLPDGHHDGHVDDEEAHDAAHCPQDHAGRADRPHVLLVSRVEVLARDGAVVERAGGHHVGQGDGFRTCRGKEV